MTFQPPSDVFTSQPKYKFSQRSLERLLTCNNRLELICRLVANDMDISIVCGHRDEEDQNAAYYSRPQRSKLKFPHSKHNQYPSLAVDIAPYVNGGIPWNDHNRFHEMAGRFLTYAALLDIPVEWGGHWRTFKDMPHFQLAGDGIADDVRHLLED